MDRIEYSRHIDASCSVVYMVPLIYTRYMIHLLYDGIDTCERMSILRIMVRGPLRREPYKCSQGNDEHHTS